ncbi:MAG: type I 3-dehydroquinate dehydratase [Thermoanaerobaculia bacterium]|nr:type I 3-dehydroquinate dehydratase [Thermoanaerobaculia bacterium]
MSEATLVATLTTPPEEDGRSLAALAGRADVLEVRADLVGDLDPGWLRERFPGRLLYTLRSRGEGGRFEGSRERRRLRLAAAAGGYDLLDLEQEHDLAEPLLAAIPPERRVLSWHGPAAPPDILRRRFESLAEIPAALYKLVPHAAHPGEELAPLLLLRELGRRDLVAFATGELGAWTRLVAPRLGAAWLFAAAGELPAAPGQPTLAALERDFGLPRLGPVEWIAGLVGQPVAHSLSPRLHNGGYRALGLPGLYLPFHVEQFGEFWLEVVESGLLAELGLPWRGLSVTTPHKDAALAVAGVASPLATLAGSANTLLFAEGALAGRHDGRVRRRRVARRARPRAAGPLGGGGGGRGAGRAVAAGLAHAGARVVVANRSGERGRAAAAELGCDFVPLAEVDPAAFDVIVNATPLGRLDGDELPVPLAAARTGTVAVDLVYLEGPTRWLEEASRRGLRTVDGREVLLQQARPQFRTMTGAELPLPLGRELLGLGAVS